MLLIGLGVNAPFWWGLDTLAALVIQNPSSKRLFQEGLQDDLPVQDERKDESMSIISSSGSATQGSTAKPVVRRKSEEQETPPSDSFAFSGQQDSNLNASEVSGGKSSKSAKRRGTKDSNQNASELSGGKGCANAASVSVSPTAALSSKGVERRIHEIMHNAAVLTETSGRELSTEDREHYADQLSKWQQGKIVARFDDRTETAPYRGSVSKYNEARAHLEAQRADAVQDNIEFYRSELYGTTTTRIDDSTKEALADLVLDVLKTVDPRVAVLAVRFDSIHYSEVVKVAKLYNTIASPETKLKVESPSIYNDSEWQWEEESRYKKSMRETLGGENGPEAALKMKQAVVKFLETDKSKIFDHISSVAKTHIKEEYIEHTTMALCNHLLYSRDYRMTDAPETIFLMARDDGQNTATGQRIAESKEEYGFMLREVYAQYEKDCVTEREKFIYNPHFNNRKRPELAEPFAKVFPKVGE